MTGRKNKTRKTRKLLKKFYNISVFNNRSPVHTAFLTFLIVCEGQPRSIIVFSKYDAYFSSYGALFCPHYQRKKRLKNVKNKKRRLGKFFFSKMKNIPYIYMKNSLIN